MSMLVEHRWFEAVARWLEAGRCLRLYYRNRALALLAAATWLPYGDLHHFAHPSARWNYRPSSNGTWANRTSRPTGGSWAPASPPGGTSLHSRPSPRTTTPARPARAV
ncbi:hypothetical protein [Streptomyces sp. NPDC015125]|uniref:hypothetical protein n=1 Tax=Streptomyces sp. NPDC015125 TaxID=3364938 RepID=UPI0036FB4CF8